MTTPNEPPPTKIALGVIRFPAPRKVWFAPSICTKALPKPITTTASKRTGNTIAKLAAGITDTAVTMAAKAHLRNGRPVIVAVSTNDALAGAAENIGKLMGRKHYYFVPFGQDDPEKKPTSMVADFTKIPPTLQAALEGKQIQPVIIRAPPHISLPKSSTI